MPAKKSTEKLTATLKTLRFGVELETVGAPRSVLARALQQVVGGTVSETGRGYSVTDSQGRQWQVVRDGSLSGGECSGEVVTPPLSYSDMETLQAVVRAVWAAGGRADSSCGIHVHVGAEGFDARSLVNLVNFVARQEKLLEHSLQVAEHRRERYCKSLDEGFLARLAASRPATVQDVSKAWYGCYYPWPNRYDSSRYHGLNLNSFFYRQTVEFRYFNGTLHAGEVKAYVQLCLAMAAHALVARGSTGKRRDFDAATAKYDMRVLLLRLGLVGDEFKTARLHLTKRLAGSSVWKRTTTHSEPALLAA